MQTVQRSARSADGTAIAFERSGSGPALVMVDPALGFSGFDNIRALGARLADEFSVHTYDRRGRGASGDAEPYAIRREVEDLAAVIAQAGGSASVYGFSSGGLLALHAAAVGVAIDKLALFEPPIRPEGAPADVDLTAAIAGLVAAGRRWDAVERFLTGIGVPEEIVAEMGPMRPALEPVAHTLVYDCEISNATTFDLLSTISTPTLVLDSDGSSDDLTGGAAAIAQALPNGTRRSLPGDWHGVSDELLAPAVAEFLREG
jgi:pimeloyl-ACP methyl ester carboxylesterase